MGNLSSIREELKKFEKNFYNEAGVNCLDNALCRIREILDDSDKEPEQNIARNIMRTYKGKVAEEARSLISTETPDIERLDHLDKLMSVFMDYGFGDDPAFSSLKEEVILHHFLELLRKARGKYPEDFDDSDKRWLESLLSNSL